MNKLIEIPNRVKQPSSCCVYCGKGYKTRTGLDKHLILCEVIYKTNKSNNKNKTQTSFLEDEEDELPSQRRMYQIILELSQKCNKLEQQLEEVNKWVVKKKKKINVLEWLIGNITPTIKFYDLSDQIVVLEQDIEYLFTNTFVDTLSEIFSRTIVDITDSGATTNPQPIVAFVQKPNMFYIYDTNNHYEKDKIDKINEKDKTYQQEYIWRELTKDNLIKFLNLIHKKISRALSEWKKKYNEKLKSCDSTSNLYDRTLIKLMGVEFKQESTLSKVRSMIYNKIKRDMKGLIEYEFEF